MAIRRQDSILGYSVSGHGGEALDVLGAAKDLCLKTFNYLATISWAMSTFSFSPVKWYENVYVCVCVCTELKYALRWHTYQFIPYYASALLTQAHAHTHPQTIHGI